jgi:hypothetical protein
MIKKCWTKKGECTMSMMHESAKDRDSQDFPGRKESPRFSIIGNHRATISIIHETIPIAPEWIPPGSIFKGHQPYTVQGIGIELHNIRYLLECWKTPDGNCVIGQLPPEVRIYYFCS